MVSWILFYSIHANNSTQVFRPQSLEMYVILRIPYLQNSSCLVVSEHNIFITGLIVSGISVLSSLSLKYFVAPTHNRSTG
jgi:hypothetical protein